MANYEAEADLVEIDQSIIDMLTNAADNGCLDMIEIQEHVEGA